MMNIAPPGFALLRSFALISTLSLGGCTLGPDFHRPVSALPDHWPDASVQSPTLAEQSIRDNWWSDFSDPTLDHLMDKVIARNPDLKMAVERLAQSRSVFDTIAADRAPSIEGGADYSRARSSQKGLEDISGLGGKKNYNIWNTGVNSAWELDMWGRVRRAVEAADAGVTIAEADRQAVYLSLMAETASHYIKLRGVQTLLQVVEQNLAVASKTLAITQIKFEQGVASDLEVAQATALLSAMRAKIPSLKQTESETISAIGLLMAQPPGSLMDELGAGSAVPVIASRINIGVPSELAERRPDVRKAEAELHAATASIGIAQANFYPSITLSGNAGFQANQLSDLGSWGSRQFAIGPAVSIPIFEGGRLKATLRLNEAKQREAALAYQKVVLTAWHEVSDALSALENEQRRQLELGEAVNQSKRALNSVEVQYKQGTTEYLNVLAVQNMLLDNETALTHSLTSVSLAAVRLYKALGGGWQTPVAQAGA